MRDIHEFNPAAGHGLRDNIQQDWKKYLMFGSFAAAAYLLLTGKRPAGFAIAGIGMAILAAEHPEKFEEAWNRAPEFLDKGQRMMHGVSGIVDKIAEQKQKFQSRRGDAQHDYLT